MSKGKALLQSNELNCIRLPYDIELDNLIGKPTKFEKPVLGGLDDVTVRIFTFKIKDNENSLVEIIFVEQDKHFDSVDFYFQGIERLSYEAYWEIRDRVKKEELSILKQAFKILKGIKHTKVYCNSLEKYMMKTYFVNGLA